MANGGFLIILWIFIIFFSPGGNSGAFMYPFVPGSDSGQAEVNPEAYQENVSALVHESIDKLSRLGIEGADTAMEWQIRDSYQEYPGELMMDLELYEVNGRVLSFIGMGDYDYDTYEWSPTSSQVYSFDVEVFDISMMYTLFLQGVASIAGDDVAFTNIEEDTSGVNYEDGSGVQILRFHCNGRAYEFHADVNNDWFDVEMIDFMNDVLQKEGLEKKLLLTSDGYQQCILFYNTPRWAEYFKELMGYGLE